VTVDFQLPRDEIELELRWLLVLEEMFDLCVRHAGRRHLDPLLLDRVAEAREAWAADLFNEELREVFLLTVCGVLEAMEEAA
jgi:hypothetical protein